MNNYVFVGFSRIFLLGILILKGLTARRLYKSFGVKGLIQSPNINGFSMLSNYLRLHKTSSNRV
jgi:hypothetical protein